MATLTGRSRATELLTGALETSPGSGVFEIDDRLRVEEVSLESDERISTARFSVRLDNDFDTAAARARYCADLRVVVKTTESDAADETVLFEGYPPVQQAQWRGGPGRGTEAFGFVATHVYERLSRDRRAWAYGRHMRTGAIADGLLVDPSMWNGRSELVTALPCVFNADGAANCAPTPLTLTAPDGSARSVHIFTFDDDPTGIAWSYINAMRYLVWFYAPHAGPVSEGNVFDATDTFVTTAAGTAAGSSQLIGRLLRPCESLNCEATNLVEALALLGDAAGVHVTVDSVAQGSGVRSQLRVWAPGDGRQRKLHLVRGGFHADGVPRYDASALSASDIYSANEVATAEIRWDYSRIVNAPVVLGGTKAYEMTVPLVPGWLPTADLDNVAAANRAAAKLLALTPTQAAALGDDAESNAWFRKYHRDGSGFVDNRFVARRWVLNEDGRFDGATYNRNAPFDAYQPFDFSTVTSSDITRRGNWSRRSRELLPTITRTALGARLGVFVEVSFDGGSTWHRPVGAAAVLRDPTAIVFEVTNPLQITPPGVDPAEQNLWYAIIDQTFRVRATALIEGDDRLIAAPAANDSGTPTLLTTTRVTHRPSLYEFLTRQGTTNVLASVNASGTDIDRDDSAAIEAFALTTARDEQDRRVIAEPVIPWLDKTFTIGDRVESIRGRGVSFVTGSGSDAAAPVVVGKRFRFDGGQWETALSLEHADGVR